MIETDLSGYGVTMYSGVWEQCFRLRRLTAFSLDFLFCTRPRALSQQTPPEPVWSPFPSFPPCFEICLMHQIRLVMIYQYLNSNVYICNIYIRYFYLVILIKQPVSKPILSQRISKRMSYSLGVKSLWDSCKPICKWTHGLLFVFLISNNRR